MNTAITDDFIANLSLLYYEWAETTASVLSTNISHQYYYKLKESIQVEFN